MTSRTPALRPLSCWKSILRHARRPKTATRSLTTYHRSIPPSSQPFPPSMTTPGAPHVNRKIKTYPPPPSPAAQFKDPVSSLQSSQISLLDPTGARTSLFSRTSPEAAHVGDILLVRLRNGDPFAGVCINIRRRGVDTGILLRNELTKVGVEMWFKVYSPNVEGIEVVQRREKRARRARLMYMRKKEHDRGSVQAIVAIYLRQKAAGRGGVSSERIGNGKGKGKKGRK